MAESARIAMPASIAIGEVSSSRASAIPWYIWSSAIAVTSTTFGLYWDISWHGGIGAIPSGLPLTWPFNSEQ